MNAIKSIFSFLAGKKTYIVAILGIAYGIATNNIELVQISLLGLTGRAAISKLE